MFFYLLNVLSFRELHSDGTTIILNQELKNKSADEQLPDLIDFNNETEENVKLVIVSSETQDKLPEDKSADPKLNTRQSNKFNVKSFINQLESQASISKSFTLKRVHNKAPGNFKNSKQKKNPMQAYLSKHYDENNEDDYETIFNTSVNKYGRELVPRDERPELTQLFTNVDMDLDQTNTLIYSNAKEVELSSGFAPMELDSSCENALKMSRYSLTANFKDVDFDITSNEIEKTKGTASMEMDSSCENVLKMSKFDTTMNFIDMNLSGTPNGIKQIPNGIKQTPNGNGEASMELNSSYESSSLQKSNFNKSMNIIGMNLSESLNEMSETKGEDSMDLDYSQDSLSSRVNLAKKIVEQQVGLGISQKLDQKLAELALKRKGSMDKAAHESIKQRKIEVEVKETEKDQQFDIQNDLKENEESINEAQVNDLIQERELYNQDYEIEETKIEDDTKINETKYDETTKIEDDTKIEESKFEETRNEEIRIDDAKIDEEKIDEEKIDETKVDETKIDDDSKIEYTKEELEFSLNTLSTIDEHTLTNSNLIHATTLMGSLLETSIVSEPSTLTNSSNSLQNVTSNENDSFMQLSVSSTSTPTISRDNNSQDNDSYECSILCQPSFLDLSCSPTSFMNNCSNLDAMSYSFMLPNDTLRILTDELQQECEQLEHNLEMNKLKSQKNGSFEKSLMEQRKFDGIYTSLNNYNDKEYGAFFEEKNEKRLLISFLKGTFHLEVLFGNLIEKNSMYPIREIVGINLNSLVRPDVELAKIMKENYVMFPLEEEHKPILIMAHKLIISNFEQRTTEQILCKYKTSENLNEFLEEFSQIVVRAHEFLMELRVYVPWYRGVYLPKKGNFFRYTKYSLFSFS